MQLLGLELQRYLGSSCPVLFLYRSEHLAVFFGFELCCSLGSMCAVIVLFELWCYSGSSCAVESLVRSVHFVGLFGFEQCYLSCSICAEVFWFVGVDLCSVIRVRAVLLTRFDMSSAIRARREAVLGTCLDRQEEHFKVLQLTTTPDMKTMFGDCPK